MRFDYSHSHFFQKTIKRPISFHGIGLHSGLESTLILRPAPVNTGVIFVKHDTVIPAHYDYVISTSYCTTLGKDHIEIKTVEHFLAALSFLGIDNLICEISGLELPILDGSSSIFCEKILNNGLEVFDIPKKWALVTSVVHAQYQKAYGFLEPYHCPLVSVVLEYQHPCLPLESLHAQGNLLDKNLVQDMSFARTYGFEKDKLFYQKHELAQGASPANAIIFGDKTIVNPEGLRYPNEIARHKVLDCVGDLFLFGYFVWGRYCATHPGHGLTLSLMRELSAQSAFRFVSSEEIVSCYVD